MARSRPRLSTDTGILSEGAHLRDCAAWLGMLSQTRAGASQRIADIPRREDRNLGLALKAQLDGHALVLHTKRCKRRDSQCRCANARLVAGAKA